MTMKQFKEKYEKRKKVKGVSMVSLVITIIIMLVLSAIVFAASMQTVDEADYSKYVSNVSDVSTAFYEASTAVNGEKVAESNEKKETQVYNYVAKAGKGENDFLAQNEVPSYTILKDEEQIGIKLPKMKVESGTGKRVPVTYATTKNGKIFTWPPYDYDNKLYITDFDTVEHKMQTEIVVGGEKITLKLDPVKGTLLDIVDSSEEGGGNSEGNPEGSTPGETLPEGEHNFTGKVQSEEYLYSNATCTEPAKYYFKCLQCNEKGTETYTVGVPLEHNYGELVVVKTPNCTEKGSKQQTCSRCGVISVMEIDKDASKHTGGESSEITLAATCTNTGTKTYKCSGCKVTLRTETIPALNHSYGEFVTSQTATCKDKGIKERKCIRCSNIETIELSIDTTKHYGEEVEGAVTEATCTEAGSITYKCSLCNAELRTENKPALNHSYGEYKVTTEATCVAKGEKERTCTRCNNVEKVEIAKDSSVHHGSEVSNTTQEATCTETGTVKYTCSGCNATLSTETIAALGHKDSDGDGVCDRCKKEIEEYKLSGIWTFNDELMPHDEEKDIIQEINFTTTLGVLDTSQKLCSEIKLSYRTGVIAPGLEYDQVMIYYHNDTEYTVYSTEYSWDGSLGKTITFTSEQSVSKEFYDWFTANAIPIHIDSDGNGLCDVCGVTIGSDDGLLKVSVDNGLGFAEQCIIQSPDMTWGELVAQGMNITLYSPIGSEYTYSFTISEEYLVDSNYDIIGSVSSDMHRISINDNFGDFSYYYICAIPDEKIISLYGIPKNIITFTINRVEYQAVEGMTWKTWCDTDYNVDKFYVEEETNRILYYFEDPSIKWYVYHDNGTLISADEVIVNNGDYEDPGL